MSRSLILLLSMPAVKKSSGGKMLSRPIIFFISILLALLQGCATDKGIPALWDVQEGQGLLVARIYVPDMRRMDNASVDIDGRLHPGSMSDGYIAIALEAGEHKFNKLRVEGQLLGANVIDTASPYRLTKGGGAPSFIYIP